MTGQEQGLGKLNGRTSWGEMNEDYGCRRTMTGEFSQSNDWSSALRDELVSFEHFSGRAHPCAEWSGMRGGMVLRMVERVRNGLPGKDPAEQD